MIFQDLWSIWAFQQCPFSFFSDRQLSCTHCRRSSERKRFLGVLTINGRMHVVRSRSSFYDPEENNNRRKSRWKLGLTFSLVYFTSLDTLIKDHTLFRYNVNNFSFFFLVWTDLPCLSRLFADWHHTKELDSSLLIRTRLIIIWWMPVEIFIYKLFWFLKTDE